jgi:ribosomal protein S18 acetylase RimI-like enzyme
MRIEPFDRRQLDAVIRLSLRAWAPVFDSIQKVMDSNVYRMLHPDWRVTQRKAVEDACSATDAEVWVAIEGDSVVGFVTVKLHSAVLGEIYMIAVDPDYQRRGIGTGLANFALDWMKKAKRSVAMIDTGGDPGHAPARRTYEGMGFRELPIARYFKEL